MLLDKIKTIETKNSTHPDWFFHAFAYTEDLFTNILNEGIKCRRLVPKKLKKEYSGFNGEHYISLSKMEQAQEEYSSFLFYKSKPAFIISNIKPTKCLWAFEDNFITKTRWPIRYSGFHDEYQMYRHIPPEKIIGLRCSLLEWTLDNYKYYLKSLKQMILLMKEYNICLPIYDYSRVTNHTAHLLNQEAYLELYEEIINSFESKEDKQKIYIP